MRKAAEKDKKENKLMYLLNEMNSIIQPILDLCDSLIPVMLMVVGSVGSLWCILLGVKYAKADDPQEHEKAKKGLINAIVGFVLIFVLLIMLKIGGNIFTDWWANYEI